MVVSSPADLGPQIRRALELHKAGQLAEAEKIYRFVLAVNKNQFEALHFLGLIEAQRGNFSEADRLISQSLSVNKKTAEAFSNHARVLNALKRHNDALAACRKALSLNHRSFEALTHRGNAMQELGRLEDALTSYNDALAIKLDYALAFSNRGNVHLKLGRREEALRDFDQAIALRANLPEAWLGRGNVNRELRRYADASAAYERALSIKTDLAAAWLGRGNIFLDLLRHDDALLAFQKALSFDPGLAEAWHCLGNAMFELRRFAEALSAYERALAVQPDLELAAGTRMHVKTHCCDWSDFDGECSRLLSGIRDDSLISIPFQIIPLPSTLSDQLSCAQRYVRDQVLVNGRAPPRLCAGLPQATDGETSSVRARKLKIAYLSADFHAHATAYLMAGLFEMHDREHFEVIGMSFGHDDNTNMRRRVVRAFDQFHEVAGMSDRAAAEQLHGLGVDIAVDLKGYTKGCRPAILSHRPAPIQVNYLGYPGTMGADFIDYIIADAVTVPSDHAPYYMEKIVQLPGSYQINDGKRVIAESTPSREEAGLPERGFVFCCFNNNYKLTPPIFDIWMRLLLAMPGSVLWLLSDKAVQSNLCREAQARGVDPARLVFADRQQQEQHLARHRLADLFLDTLPYNSHTTASDALWAGLPVLTCLGTTFAGRVAAGILQAVGLQELVTDNLADYEALALKLANDPQQLAAVRKKLAQNRQTHLLFDTDRFRRHLEAAYRTMWDIHARGEAPRSFTVAPIG